jgi:hypothetical protein
MPDRQIWALQTDGRNIGDHWEYGVGSRKPRQDIRSLPAILCVATTIESKIHPIHEHEPECSREAAFHYPYFLPTGSNINKPNQYQHIVALKHHGQGI